MEANKHTAPSVGASGFLSSSSHASSSPEAAYSDAMIHHTASYASDCPWNPYDNVPPTPLPAFSDDHEFETDHQDYYIEPTNRYNRQETAVQDPGSTEFEASPRPTTPMGALATPPQGYEWYISPAFEAHLVPLSGTASTSAHVNSAFTGISVTLAPYGLPTPPPEAIIDCSHSRADRHQCGLPQWLSADLEQKLMDVLDEKDQVWTGGKRVSADR